MSNLGVICTEVEREIVLADDLGNRRCVYRNQLGPGTEPWGTPYARDGQAMMHHVCQRTELCHSCMM